MIIGLSGYAKSGKDTVADIIISIDSKQWVVKKFSGKLKQIASLLTGIDINKFEDQDFKDQIMPLEWVEQWVEGTTKYYKIMKVRDFLQKLGTEAVRDGLHKNAWVNALMSDYYGIYDIDTDVTNMPNWIITDCRFPNEFEAIRQSGGVVIRISRNGVKPVNAHPSEIALDGFDFDYVIENNGSLEDLKRSVNFMLNKLNESRSSI
jgi:hypothetical protein